MMQRFGDAIRAGEDRAGSDEGPEVVLWRWNSSPERLTVGRDWGPTSQVAGEDAVYV